MNKQELKNLNEVVDAKLLVFAENLETIMTNAGFKMSDVAIKLIMQDMKVKLSIAEYQKGR